MLGCLSSVIRRMHRIFFVVVVVAEHRDFKNNSTFKEVFVAFGLKTLIS